MTELLAVGSGRLFACLVASLLESGFHRFHVLFTDSTQADRQRFLQLVGRSRQAGADPHLTEVSLPSDCRDGWQEAVNRFDCILYVSQDEQMEQLKLLQSVCRERNIMLLPAICVGQTGLAGPIVRPDAGGCWESAFRRVHRAAVYGKERLQAYSSAAGALLANALVFLLIESRMERSQSSFDHKLFFLDLETLEGDWEPFIPHPLVYGLPAAHWIEDVERLEQNGSASGPDTLLPFFERLTSNRSGILYSWSEGDLNQLPLSQCRVQAADPLSNGPAELLPGIICAGLTHPEARREAGLTGIESYAARLLGPFARVRPHDYVGVGAGETLSEAVCRGLQKCLTEELNKRSKQGTQAVHIVRLDAIEDKACRYYWQALTTIIGGMPVIGLGAEVSGFPVVWVGMGRFWCSVVDINLTMALRRALLYALQHVQNETDNSVELTLTPERIESKVSLSIPSFEGMTYSHMLQTALPLIAHKRLIAFDLAVEPFLKDAPIKVLGIHLEEGNG